MRGRPRAASGKRGLLHETGLFRFHQPRRFGGMELPFIAVVDIVAELARGCPSTAWNVGNLGCHHWILGYYEPQTQHEVWDENPDADSQLDCPGGRPRQEGRRRLRRKWPLAVLVRRGQLPVEHARRHGLWRRWKTPSTGGYA